MLLTFEKFSGIAPSASPYKLAPGMAQVALNVDLTARTVRGLREPLTVLTGLEAADESTIYRFGQDLISDTQYWFHWPVDVDVVKGQLSNDQTERTYFTHPTLGPRVTDNTLALSGGSGDYPWNSRPLGVPAPTAEPTASILVAGDAGVGAETRIYCFTYVTSSGEESAPSTPTEPIEVNKTGATVRLSGLGTTPPSGYDHITAKRVYRTISGSVATDFQLVDEIGISQATYDDSKTAEQVARSELIATVTWAPPPAEAFGIFNMSNGIAVLLTDYDVYPSEAYIPYAYPVAYSSSTEFKIVAGAGMGTTAVILTTGSPYLLAGSDPSAMTLDKLSSTQACASKRSVAKVDGGVMYASPDGLILVTPSGEVVNVTERWFTHEKWQELNPSSIHGYYHDGRYIGFYKIGSTEGGFIFDPRKGEDAAFSMVNLYATAGYTDHVQDALYLKVGTEIVKWAASEDTMPVVHKSGIVSLPKPMNMTCAKVIASEYPVTCKFFMDGVLRFTKAAASRAGFRLPSGFRCERLEIQIEGEIPDEVLAVFVADSMDELGTV